MAIGCVKCTRDGRRGCNALSSAYVYVVTDDSFAREGVESTLTEEEEEEKFKEQTARNRIRLAMARTQRL